VECLSFNSPETERQPKTRQLADFLLDLLFPLRCLNCSAPKNKHTNPQGYLCKTCLAQIRLNSWLFCPVCNRKLAQLNRCLTHLVSGLRVLGVACNYHDPLIKKLLWQYKYEFAEALSVPLAQILSLYFQKVFLPLTSEQILVCPMPLFPKRERWRGFNQAQLLAEHFAWQNQLHYQPLLKRIKFSQPQMRLKQRKQRFANIKESFCVLPETEIRGKTILLIDDIATSGATIIEAAKTLKKAGAKKVYGLVLARNL